MHINKLINPGLLFNEVQNGGIRVQEHPALPLKLYNYTEKAQFAKRWNTATLNCRGLIVHENGEIVARPFPKFFNWDEPKPKGSRFQMALDEPVIVTDKIDGSLGILFQLPGTPQGPQFATRGSFSSDQAAHANKVFFEKYWDYRYQLRTDLTYLFEIVYPENRIVVNYGDMDDLVLLGAVHIETGRVMGPEMFPGWPGPKTQVLPYRTLSEAVSARPRPGKEGFVVRSLNDGLMLKIKQEDYVSLHRVVTGLNEKEIWRRCLKADLENPLEIDKLGLILRDIPDELHGWVSEVVLRLYTGQRRLRNQVWNRWYAAWGFKDTRKEFAIWQQNGGLEPWLCSALWLLYDGKSIDQFLWKQIEPRGDVKK